MKTLQQCHMCNKELMCIDIEAQLYEKLQDYYIVKELKESETWESCNPHNKFVAYCKICFSPQLEACKSRVKHFANIM